MKIRTPRRRSALAIAVCLAMTGGGLATATYATAGATPSNTLDLRILLIGDGPTDVTTAAWGSALANEGVPYTEVDATGTSPSETIALPALSSGTTGYFNGVVIADSPPLSPPVSWRRWTPTSPRSGSARSMATCTRIRRLVPPTLPEARWTIRWAR